MAAGDLASLRVKKLDFTDTRGSNRRLVITARTGEAVEAECSRTFYLLRETNCGARATACCAVGRLSPQDQPIVLRKGDTIVLSDKLPVGKDADYDESGGVLRPATITCSIPEILGDLKAGERVWFDDGKIGGMIQRVANSEAVIEITHAAAAGAKLRGNKGINLPDRDLHFASLTPKDLQDLQFAAEQADVVGMSFVRSPADVEGLQHICSGSAPATSASS